MGCIYLITNSVNGKCYVGQTLQADSQRRWRRHKVLAAMDSPTALHAAIRKYGSDAFRFETIEQCNVAEINDRESAWIERLNTLSPNGYNLTRGGDGFKGRHNAETRAKIGVASDPEFTRKIQKLAVLANTGAKRSPEARKRMSEAAKRRRTFGRIMSPEVRAKISESIRRGWQNGTVKGRWHGRSDTS
jgi:group I intron endonuclease